MAIKYEWKKDLLDYISDEALKGKLSKLSEQRKKDYEKIRDKAKDTYEDKLNNIAASFTITGGLSVETNVKYNFLTKSYSFAKQAGNFYDEARGVVAFGQFVKVAAKIEINIIKESSFFFNLITTKFEGKLKFEIKSSFGIYQQYGKDDAGFYVENYLAFSGLKITLTASVKLAIIKYTIFDFNVHDEKDKEKPKEYRGVKKYENSPIYIKF